MIKKVIKLFGIILILLMIINLCIIDNTKCYGMSDVTKNTNYWKPSNRVDSARFNQKVGAIASVVRNVGIIISVGTLIAIGIKFMLGSVEEKAQYKQTLIPWLIGAILIFAMTSLPSLIYNISTNMFAETKIMPSGPERDRVDLPY